MSNAAARLDMAVQTVSTQVRELERDLGCKLLRPAGRGLALTEAGVVVLRQAESIFQLGEALPELVGAAAQSPSVRLVGACDGVQENYYAISTERKLAHPLVLQLVQRSAEVGAAQ